MRPKVDPSPGGPLRRLGRGGKRIGKKIGDFQARVLLTVFYFVLIAPFALVVRWASDPLALKPASPRGWRPRSAAPPPAVETARRQF